MKLFFKNLLLALLPFVSLNIVGFGILVILSVHDDLTYVNYASALDKEKRLKMLADQPRLVIIGGSNTRFAFDSQVLKDSLSIAPVNMGIHVGLGLNYMFEEVEAELHKGDVLLVSAEYNHFLDEDTYRGGEAVMDMHLIKHEWSDALRQMVETHNYFALYRLSRRRLKRRGMRLEDIPSGMEIRTQYNEYGDYVGHYNLPSPQWSPEFLPKTPPCESVMMDLNDKIISLRQRGVGVFFLPPPYCQSSFSQDSLVVGKIAHRLEQAGCPFLALPRECVYPDSLFFDSHYHLKHQGALLHSQKIVRCLRNCADISSSDMRK